MSLRRAWASFVSIALCGAVIAPLLRNPVRDSFPLSTYPMFATPPGPLSVTRVEAELVSGERQVVPARLFGPSHAVQSRVLLERAVQERAGLRRLCAEIARNMWNEGQQVLALEFVRVDFNAVAYVLGNRSPRARRVLDQCRVPPRRHRGR